MQLWKLTVLDPNTPHWDLSTYKGGLIVRAEGEHQARMKATQEFAIATQTTPCQSTKWNPWFQPEVVACEQYTGSEFPTDGDPSVLKRLDA